MRTPTFAFLFIAFNCFAYFASGQIIGSRAAGSYPTQSHNEAQALRDFYNRPQTPRPSTTYTPSNNYNNSNSSASGNSKPAVQKTKAEIEYDNMIWSAKNIRIDDPYNNYTGMKIHFFSPEISVLHGKYIGKTKNKSGEEVHVVWASPYMLNNRYENMEYIYFVRWAAWGNNLGTLYKKYLKSSFNSVWDVMAVVNSDIAAERTKIEIEKENQAKIENSVRDLKSALSHNIVSFVDSFTFKHLTGNISLSHFANGYRLRIWSGLDSIFILTDGRNDRYKTWYIYLVDLTKQPRLPIGSIFLSLQESNLNPNGSVQWSIDKYFTEAEKRVNKKLGKKSVDEMIAYYNKMDKERRAKEEAERKKTEQETLAKIKLHKAKRKPAGSLIKNSPFHSIIPFYRSEDDEQSSHFYLFNYEGYKLAVQAKDSFFILSEFNNNFEIILIDQTKNPANDEGVVLREAKKNVTGFPSVFGQRELSNYFPAGAKGIQYQEDFIREIEKRIYTELGKEIPGFLKQTSPPAQTISNIPYKHEFTISNWYKYWGTISMRATNRDDISPAYIGYHFGTHRKMNNLKKNYYQEKKQDFKTVDTVSQFTGDLIYNGIKEGLGVLKNHDSGYLFRGYFSYNEQRRDGIRNNKDGSKTIISNTEVFTIHNDGSIIIFPDVLWKGQKEIRVRPVNETYYAEMRMPDNNAGYSSLSEKNMLRTDSSITIAKEFLNKTPGQKFISVNKQGDIYLGSYYTISEKILYKKNGVLYSHNEFAGTEENIFNGNIYTKEGLYITENGIYRGILLNGVMDIYGDYLDDKKAERYSGPYKEGKRHGFGKLFTIGTDANKNERMRFKNVIYNNGVLKQ